MTWLGSDLTFSRAYNSDHCTILPLMGVQGCGWGPWSQSSSAFHTIAIKVAQQQAQVKVHSATSGCVQAIAVSSTVDGIPVQQLRPTTYEGPCQLLPPAAQGPPCGTVKLVGARTAGHVAKAVACKLAAAEAILGPHLEMEPGPACKTGGTEGWAQLDLPILGPHLLDPHWRPQAQSFLPWISALVSSLDSHSHRAAKRIFLNPCFSPAQNPSMAPQCLQDKIQPQHSRPFGSSLC